MTIAVTVTLTVNITITVTIAGAKRSLLVLAGGEAFRVSRSLGSAANRPSVASLAGRRTESRTGSR
jgi:hypothetical protein